MFRYFFGINFADVVQGIVCQIVNDKFWITGSRGDSTLGSTASYHWLLAFRSLDNSALVWSVPDFVQKVKPVYCCWIRPAPRSTRWTWPSGSSAPAAWRSCGKASFSLSGRNNWPLLKLLYQPSGSLNLPIKLLFELTRLKATKNGLQDCPKFLAISSKPLLMTKRFHLFHDYFK